MPLMLVGDLPPGLDPVAPGRWPLLPLADWRRGRVPVAVVERKGTRLVTRIEA